MCLSKDAEDDEDAARPTPPLASPIPSAEVVEDSQRLDVPEVPADKMGWRRLMELLDRDEVAELLKGVEEEQEEDHDPEPCSSSVVPAKSLKRKEMRKLIIMLWLQLETRNSVIRFLKDT